MIISEPCSHCHNPIEFEAEEMQVGESVTCQSCGHATQLKLPGRCAPPRKSGINPAHLTIAIAGGVLFLTVIAITLFKRGDIASSLGIAGVGVIWIFLAIMGFVLAILWLIFPWIVYTELRRTQKILEQIRDGRKQ